MRSTTIERSEDEKRPWGFGSEANQNLRVFIYLDNIETIVEQKNGSQPKWYQRKLGFGRCTFFAQK